MPITTSHHDPQARSFRAEKLTYHTRLVVVGDIARHVAASTALGDLVRESNKGAHVWFVADLAELDERLG